MKKISIVAMVSLFVLGAAVFAADNYKDKIQALDLPASSKSVLSNITDPSIKKAVENALQGKCDEQQIKGSKIKVDHKKQCEPKGRPPKVPNGKDGKPCYVQGLQGGSVTAMCLNGCCVAVKVNSSLDVKNTGGTDSKSLFSGMESPQVLQSILKMFQGLSGLGGGDDSSYNYPNYDYSYDNYDYTGNTSNDDYNHSSDSWDWQYNLPDSTYGEEDSTVYSEEDVASETDSGKSYEDSINTEIIKIGNKTVNKKDIIKTGNGLDLRYNFADNSYNLPEANEEQIRREIIKREQEAIKLRDTNTSAESSLIESPVTGFTEEEAARISREPSWIDKIIAFFRSLLY